MVPCNLPKINTKESGEKKQKTFIVAYQTLKYEILRNSEIFLFEFHGQKKNLSKVAFGYFLGSQLPDCCSTEEKCEKPIFPHEFETQTPKSKRMNVQITINTTYIKYK